MDFVGTRVLPRRSGLAVRRPRVFIYVRGKPKPIRVSSGTENREEAVRMRRQRMASAARDAEYSDQIEQVLVDQLLDLVLEDYRSTNELVHTILSAGLTSTCGRLSGSEGRLMLQLR